MHYAYRFVSSILCAVICILLLTACGLPSALDTPPTATTTTPVPQATEPKTETNCPQPGQARGARLPDFTPGNDDNIIYVRNQGTAQQLAGISLQRYDVVARRASSVVQAEQGYIEQAFLSANGQWVLFINHLSTQQVAIQLVRLDGQYLQTVYCSSTNILHAHWSPDQQTLAFSEGKDSSIATIFLLDVSKGILRIALPPATPVFPSGWLDNKTLSLVSFLPNTDAPEQNLYTLDTTKGVVQTLDTLLLLSPIQAYCFDVAPDPARKQLFLSTCTGGGAAAPGIPYTGESTVTQHALPKNTPTTVYSSPTLAVTGVNVSGNTLLLLINNGAGDQSQNGLWMMNTDGSARQQITNTSAAQEPSLNSFSNTPVSNLSRDANLYALKLKNKTTQTATLIFGSVKDHNSTQFDQSTGTSDCSIVGWSTM